MFLTGVSWRSLVACLVWRVRKVPTHPDPGRVAGRLGSVTSPHPCGLRASSQGPSSRRSDLSQVTQGATHPPGFVEAGSGSCQCPRAVSLLPYSVVKAGTEPPSPPGSRRGVRHHFSVEKTSKNLGLTSNSLCRQ